MMIIDSLKKQAELLMMNGSYATALYRLATASDFFRWCSNLQNVGTMKTKTTTEVGYGDAMDLTAQVHAMYPIPSMYNLHIHCCRRVGAIVEAIQILTGLANQANSEKEYQMSQARILHEQITQLKKQRGVDEKTQKLKYKIINAQIKAAIKAAKEAKQQHTKWDGLAINERQHLANAQADDYKAHTEKDPYTSRKEIDMIYFFKYQGGLFSPNHIMRIEDYKRFDAATGSFVECFPAHPSIFDIETSNLAVPFDGIHLFRPGSTYKRNGVFSKKAFKKGDVIDLSPPSFFATIDECSCVSCGFYFGKTSKSCVACPGPCNKQAFYCSDKCLQEDKPAHSLICKEECVLRRVRTECRNAGRSTGSRAQFLTMRIMQQWNSGTLDSDERGLVTFLIKLGEKRFQLFPEDKLSLKDFLVQYNAAVKLSGIDPMKSSFDFYVYCCLVNGVLMSCVVAGSNTENGNIGPYRIPANVAIYDIYPHFNHKCISNAFVQTNKYEDGRYPIKIIAKENIAEGEEIFIHLGDIATIDRRSRLNVLQSYGIPEDHECELCDIQKEIPDDEQLDIMLKSIIHIGGPMADEIKKLKATAAAAEAEAATTATAAASAAASDSQAEAAPAPAPTE
jgi:hypothetical protein